MIISLLFERDERGLAEFETKYRKLCLIAAENITGDAGSAEECHSDLLLRLWNSIPPERPDSLKFYALKIIRNLALNVIRRNNAKKRSAILVELDDCEPAAVDENELSELLDRFLETLDRTDAKIFLRRYIYCVSVNEIAASLGTKPNRISKNLAKTREKLRKFLAEEGYAL